MVWEILESASDSFLEQVFLEAFDPGRSRIRRLLHSADEKAERDWERKVNAYCIRMLTKSITQDMMPMGVLPGVFTPSLPVAPAAPKVSSAAAVKTGEQVRRRNQPTGDQQAASRTDAALITDEDFERAGWTRVSRQHV